MSSALPNTLEAAKDREAFKSLFTKDTKVNVSESMPPWDRITTKTTFLENSIKKFNEKEINVVLKIEEIKINGGFFANNHSEIRYILHKEDSQWKISDAYVLKVEFDNPSKLFDQAISVPDDVKSTIYQIYELCFPMACVTCFILIQSQTVIYRSFPRCPYSKSYKLRFQILKTAQLIY
jgi:hypothetical protein